MFKAALLVVGVLGSAMALAADQAMQAQYSGVMTMETSAGVMKGPVAAMPGKQRREYVMDGESMVTITRFDKGVSWMLMPSQKMYMETKLDASSTTSGSGDVAGYQMEYTDEGPDTVNGVATTKSKIIMTSKDGTKFGGFAWRTNDGIVVKLDALAKAEDSKERIKLDITELNVGPQDPQLFEIPAGYSPMNMAGMMMQGLTGAGAGEGSDANAEQSGAPEAETAPPKKKKWGLKDAIDLVK